jgi:protein SCO1
MVALTTMLRRLLAACLAVAATHAWAQQDAPGQKLDQQAAFNASQAAVGRAIGDHRLQAAGGRTVHLRDYRGKPLLVSFIYTGCFQTCPTDTLKIAGAVSAVQDLLGHDVVRVASIGFNVPFDSPEAMAAFARQQGISMRGWDFLSPSVSTVATLTNDFGFRYVASPKGFDHVTQLTVVDRNGRIYRQLYGDGLNPQAIVAALRDMDNGTVPVAQGWSGVAARFRLLCSVYDSDSASYRSDYSLIVGILAGISILGSVAWMLGSEWRKQRRTARASRLGASRALDLHQ